MTSPTRIAAVDFEPLDVPLLEPFVIATGRLDAVHNVLVRVTLVNGVMGYGEAAPFEAISGENQATILATLTTAGPLILGEEGASYRHVSQMVRGVFHAQAAARAGLEMALLDAVTRAWGVPLYEFLGGATDRVETDLTIPIMPPADARRNAAEIQARGIRVIKTKVGQHVAEDIERIQAIREGFPDCDLILDANAGFTASEALRVLDRLHRAGIEPILFEQPVAENDWAGLRLVTQRSPVPIAADETVRTAADALRIAQEGAAHVVNIKLMKSGLVEALDIAAVARAAHLGLMIGGMIETRLAMTCSAHVAAGLGGFRYIDLDTPMLLAHDPFVGGYRQDGAVYTLDHIQAGLGVTPVG